MSETAASEPTPPVLRLLYISLTSADLARLAGFYEQAFGFRQERTERHTGPAFERLMQVGAGAQGVWLALGRQRLELLQFDAPGASYPPHSSSCDRRFQHFALVVTDMQRAFERLRGVPGWSAISTGGALWLPARSGGVCAFKFRDPEGHPLELLEFPELPLRWRAQRSADERPLDVKAASCLGIDHSALSVADSARSVHFYEALGLTVSGSSLNTGDEQARLDGLADPRVEVTALTPRDAPPHVELLRYERPQRPARAFSSADVSRTRGVDTQDAPDIDAAIDAPVRLQSNDIAATRLVFASRRPLAAPRLLHDPDGHHLMLV